MENSKFNLEQSNTVNTNYKFFLIAPQRFPGRLLLTCPMPTLENVYCCVGVFISAVELPNMPFW